MVSCGGLYADIGDDSLFRALRRNMMKGMLYLILHYKLCSSKSGFHIMTQELSQYSENIEGLLQQLDRRDPRRLKGGLESFLKK